MKQNTSKNKNPKNNNWLIAAELTILYSKLVESSEL